MTPFVGFAPDLPPETPGVMTDCDNILPDTDGFVSGPSRVDAGIGALAAECRGFVTVRKLDNSTRTFAGTASKLYESTGGAWSEVGTGYSLATEDRWRFAQFGNVTVATAKSVNIQGATSGSFSVLDATAPKAAIVETINNQVFAFNTNDAGFGDDTNRWWCSAIGDETDWTPSVSTQCASGQLIATAGPITAGKRLGDVICAYKERSLYVGTYVGAPVIWDWRQVPGEVGAPSHESVVTTGAQHFFPGPDDFYMFDGSRPVALKSPVRQWFLDNRDPDYSYRMYGVYDRLNSRIFWWFASNSSAGVLDTCIVYHIATNRWGRMDGTIEAVAEYIEPGITYHGLGTAYSTYDSLPTDIAFDSQFWVAGNSTLSVIGTDHTAYTYTGTPGSSSITTGHFGDSTQFSTCNRVRPRFINTPATTQMLYSYSNLNADNFTQSITSAYSNGFYDMIWSARWHKFELQFTGAMTVLGIEPKIVMDGTE